MTPLRGIIIGCDKRQEWLLKWWWSHYVKHNVFPVTLFDFGVSCAARLWCQKRMHVISFPPPRSLFLPKQEIVNQALWPTRVANYVWNVRPIWFSKAFCLARAPYEENIWLDLDCEVKQSLFSLFASCCLGDGFALTQDAPQYVAAFQKCGALESGVQGYQAGVIAFRHDSPVLQSWIDNCYNHCNKEFSEQSTLSHLLHRSHFAFTSLPDCHNWLSPDVSNPEAVIIHHTGASPKRRLITRIADYKSSKWRDDDLPF